MLGIVVPLRRQPEFDRPAHLAALIQTLQHVGVPTRLVVVEEEMPSPYRFNRGALLNVGFRLLPHDVSAVLFHDVDLLPCRELLSQYTTSLSQGTVRHLGMRWGRYASNPQYLGGVVAVHPSDFRVMNGFPATFWGWGGEDDALAIRCRRAGLAIERPVAGTYTDQEQMKLLDKLALLRRTQAKCGDKWEQLAAERSGDVRPGLAEVQFELRHTHQKQVGAHLEVHHHTIRFKTPFVFADGDEACTHPSRPLAM